MSTGARRSTPRSSPGGLAAGGAVGTGVGAAIDILSGGLTMGLGTTVIGPALGSLFGAQMGSKVAAEQRMRPLYEARAAASTAVRDCDTTAAKALDTSLRCSSPLLPQKSDMTKALYVGATSVSRARR